MKIKNKLLLTLILSFLIIPIICYGVATNAGGPSSSSSASVTHSGATTISSDNTYDQKSFESTSGSENALLVSGGTSSLNSCTINKTGDSSDENADFYGTNAAIFVNGATLNITGGTVTTNGGHANAVFAYDTGVINITDTNINTSGNNSGGIMVTGGGAINAKNLTVLTSGNSSAAIRSDRGGGTLTATEGSYKTTGVGSPAIYSTANITVNDASLTATASEGAVVEGANSISLNNVTLTDTNTTLNGNSETYKNIFIYQSMSGDASEGTASFTSKNSDIITNKGDTIFVTNTTATISLENNNITNDDGDFLRIQTGKWGNSGSNGGNVTMNLINQKVSGNIIVDDISSLDLSLTEGSVLKAAIDTNNEASNIKLSLDSSSVIVLQGDSYVDSLTNEVTDNSNIYLNGYSLYVNGNKVTANEGTYEEPDTELIATNKSETKSTNMNVIIYCAAALLIIIVIVLLVHNKNKKKKKINTDNRTNI